MSINQSIIGMCRMQQFLAVLKSFFHSSLSCTFSSHPSPPTIHPSSPTSSWHLFLGLPLNLVVPKFIYNTLLRILFSSSLCTCPNQCNIFKLIVSIIVDFSLLVNILQLSFHCQIMGIQFFYTLSFKKCAIAFYLSFLVSQFLIHMLTFCLLLYSLVLILGSLICFYF
jgi:hypothetical protein